MTRPRRLYAALTLFTAVAVLVTVDSARSQTGLAGTVQARSGTFTMTSDPEDWLGRGKRYSFPSRTIAIGGTARTTPGGGGVQVYARKGSWTVEFAAPVGMRLVPGVYEDARRSPDSTHPELTVRGDGRGCSMSTGRFQVHDVTYGQAPHVRSLHATFEYHCERAEPALRGEVDVVAGSPPQPLEIDVGFEPSRVALLPNGTLELHGTIECSQAVEATVSADVNRGSGGGHVVVPRCAPAPTPWTITATAATPTPFPAQTVLVSILGIASDIRYESYVGTTAWARDTITDATADLTPFAGEEDSDEPEAGASSSEAGGGNGPPAWPLLIAFSIAGVVGWSILLRRSIRNRPRD